MVQQHSVRDERSLDLLLHAAGVLGLVVVALVASRLTPHAGQDVGPVEPGPGHEALAARLRAVHAELSTLEVQVRAAEAAVREGNRRVPPEPREGEVLRELMQIAQDTGVTIRDSRTDLPVDRAGCRQLPIHLTLSADYRGVCRFLDGVARLQRLTTVENLEIVAQPDAGLHLVAITVAVYFRDLVAADEGNRGGTHG